jgi:hypothetical protein
MRQSRCASTSLSSSSYKATNAIMGGPILLSSSNPNCLPKAPPLKPISIQIWELIFQHMHFSGTHSNHSNVGEKALLLCKFLVCLVQCIGFSPGFATLRANRAGYEKRHSRVRTCLRKVCGCGPYFGESWGNVFHPQRAWVQVVLLLHGYPGHLPTARGGGGWERSHCTSMDESGGRERVIVHL